MVDPDATEAIRYAQGADGARLGYRLLRTGSNRPVLVMIHGLASNLTRWSEFVAQTRLKDHWDLLRVDLRGHGLSLSRSRFRREDWCSDLGAILDAEGYAQAVVMGHSLGAEVAMDFARAWPGRTAGLILIDPVYPAALRGTLGIARRLRWLNRLAILVCRGLSALGLRRRQFPYRDLRALDEHTRRVLDQARAQGGSGDIAKLYMKPGADLRYIPLTNYLQDLAEVVRPVPDPVTIAAPVLVLLSAGATITDADVHRQWIERFPDAEVDTIDADHWLLTERPLEARRAIERWCEQLRASADGRGSRARVGSGEPAGGVDGHGRANTAAETKIRLE